MVPPATKIREQVNEVRLSWVSEGSPFNPICSFIADAI